MGVARDGRAEADLPADHERIMGNGRGDGDVLAGRILVAAKLEPGVIGQTSGRQKHGQQ